MAGDPAIKYDYNSMRKGYQKAIERFMRRLRQEIRVQGVILLGSWAKDEAYPSSDLDRAVISEDFGCVAEAHKRLKASRRHRTP